MKRRLAAILAADVVGYSSLMNEDEAGTLAALHAHRQELFNPETERYGGRIVKLMGDGTLVEFPSVVDAAECALAIQKALTESDGPIRLRIGINLGDVILDGEDIYGDGVNVAARLESLAEPGGICISSIVQESIGNRVAAEFIDAGQHEVKGLPRPIRVWRWRAGGESKWATNQMASSHKPSIAVLPFMNMSGDPEQEYVADGITDEITTALSRVRWFFVIARNTSFTYKGRAIDARQVAKDLGVRYLIEGGVRRAVDRVRITAQLIEATTGTHLWAKRFDGDPSDVFAMQDEITEAIVGAIEPELGKAERARVRSKQPSNLDAWDLYQRAMSHLYQYTPEDVAEAKRLFAEGLSLDPNLGPAHSGLSEAYYYELVYGFARDAAACREQALGPAQRAVALDTTDASAHCTLGRVHYMRREHEAAIRELRTAVDLNPSLALAHYGIGAALVFSGQAKDAHSHLQAAIRLSPYDPNMGSFLVRLADANYFTADYAGAVEWAKRALQQPNFQWSRYTVLLAALGQLDRLDEAKTYRDELLRQRPDASITFVRETHLISDEASIAHYLDGLIKAGVPEY